MPDAVATAEPTAPAAPAAPTQPDAPAGLESLAATFDKLVPTAEPGKPSEPAPKDKPAAPAAPSKDKPADPSKPADKPTTPALPDKGQLAKLGKTYDALKKRVETEYEPELAKLRAQVKELEGRKPAAPEMKEFETLKQERERLSRELAEAAYERGEEFKRDYLEPRKAIYDEAVREISGLSIRYQAGTGDDGQPIVKERPATEADFRTIFFLPPAQQDQAIHAWFGPSAHRVAHYISEMRRNEREAQLAIKRHAETRESKMKEEGERTRAQEKQYQDSLAASRQYLEDKWPQLFKAPPTEGDNADEELAAAHQRGWDLVKQFTESAPNLPVEEKAARSALMMARSAAFEALAIENQRLRTELSGLKQKAKAKSAADPGEGGSGTATEGGPPDDGGIEAMASVFDKVAR